MSGEVLPKFIPVIPDDSQPPLDICPSPNFVCYVSKDGSYVDVAVQADGKEVPIPESQVPEKFKSGIYKNLFKHDENGNLVITSWVTGHIQNSDWAEFYNVIEGSGSLLNQPETQSSPTPGETITSGANVDQSNSEPVFIQPTQVPTEIPSSSQKLDLTGVLPIALGAAATAVATGIAIKGIRNWMEKSRKEWAESEAEQIIRDGNRQDKRHQTKRKVRPGFFVDQDDPNTVRTTKTIIEPGSAKFNELEKEVWLDNERKEIRKGADEKWRDEQREIVSHTHSHIKGPKTLNLDKINALIDFAASRDTIEYSKLMKIREKLIRQDDSEEKRAGTIEHQFRKMLWRLKKITIRPQ